MADPTVFRRPMTLTLAVGAAVLAAFLPLVPEPYRAFNVALFGAVGLFAAGRVGFWPAVAVTLGAKLTSDVMNYAAHGRDANYLPMWEVVLCFAVYPACGRLLRRTENPLAVGGAAVLGSGLFFLLTNFGSWVRQALPYPYTADGLVQCYREGLPFYRGTFLGDVGGAFVLFAAHAVLSRVLFPAERVAVPAAIPVTTDRS
ncbi:MAG: DUF6580 family putative transport protein [Gemmataceae bacterium]